MAPPHMVRTLYARISAGVSKLGPSPDKNTPSVYRTPSSLATSCISARSFGSYASCKATHTRVQAHRNPSMSMARPRAEGSGHTHLHAWEPRADGVVVGADEDVAHLHVDVVGDSYQFAGADVLTRRAHGGCEEHRLRPNKLHHHRTRTQKHNGKQEAT